MPSVGYFILASITTGIRATGAGPVVIGRVKIARETAKWTPRATLRGNCKIKK